MKDIPRKETREEIAHREVGVTEIGRLGAVILGLGFLILLCGVPLHQHVAEWQQARRLGEEFQPASLALLRQMPALLAPIRQEGFTISAVRASNRELLAAMHAYEDLVEDASILGQSIRPGLQSLMTRYLGVGNEQVYVGRDQWLFYRPSVDYLTGPGFLAPSQLARRSSGGNVWQPAPQPDPRLAILHFHAQLAARGIVLVVVPTPVKASIHPEQLSGRIAGDMEVLQNESYRRWLADLASAGVRVFDPAGLMMDRKRAMGQAQYLATDTHWRPSAMEAVAAALADYLRPLLADTPADGSALQLESAEHAGLGDVALMLDVGDTALLFPPEPVRLQQVLRTDGQFWRPDPAADVLVLGDSFSNIYSLGPMGWGESSGLVEHLAFQLGRPVDRITRNDSGAFATRDMLRRELARGVDRLAGKRVVVWQFAARELSAGDWRIFPLVLHAPRPSRFLALDAGESMVLSGIVQDVSTVPRPGTVPYRDHIVSVHMVDLPDGEEAVVYMQSMIDNVWTPAARLRKGQEIAVRFQAWHTVSELYDAINRSELDDFALQWEPPCWGEVLEGEEGAGRWQR
jgi:hypothetical protein